MKKEYLVQKQPIYINIIFIVSYIPLILILSILLKNLNNHNKISVLLLSGFYFIFTIILLFIKSRIIEEQKKLENKFKKLMETGKMAKGEIVEIVKKVNYYNIDRKIIVNYIAKIKVDNKIFTTDILGFNHNRLKSNTVDVYYSDNDCYATNYDISLFTLKPKLITNMDKKKSIIKTIQFYILLFITIVFFLSLPYLIEYQGNNLTNFFLFTFLFILVSLIITFKIIKK